jgi:hypothetical protein
MRVGETVPSANTQFYKATSLKDEKETKDRIWLNFENENGIFSQQLIGYFDNTTNDYDSGYDGLLSDGGNYANFYSFIKEDRYKIQGRKDLIDEDEVKLGYFSGIPGAFNINIDSKEGVFNTELSEILLEDRLLGVTHNLKESPYRFTTETGTFNERFVLFLNNKAKAKVKAIDEVVLSGLVISSKDKQIRIYSNVEMIDKIQVYDLIGRSIFKKNDVKGNEVFVSDLNTGHQAFMVKVELTNGQTSTKKIICQ